MHGVALITTLTACLGLALVLGFIAIRLKIPALVGYLLAGVLLGPAVRLFAADMDLARQLSEIGIMLLMFGVGLHFSLKDLIAVRKIALPGAITEMTLITSIGAGAALLWGWSTAASLIFGLTFSVASTVVLLRAMEQRSLLRSQNGKIALGWLVVEDLAMVLILVLLPPVVTWLNAPPDMAATGGTLSADLLRTLGKVALFVVFMLVIGRRVFPWLLWQVARVNSRELFTLCVIAGSVGIAYASASLFGVSFALGAFFAGLVMQESPLSHRAAEESLPLRDAFSVLFFVSVGMLFDPRVLLEQPIKLLVAVTIVLLVKPVIAFGIVSLFRYPLNTSITAAVSLAQIGEFSFIVADRGVALGVLPPEGQSVILAASVISIALNPLLFRVVDPLLGWFRSHSKVARLFEKSEDPLAELPASVESKSVTGHVVLVGYGRVGQRIAERLEAQRIFYVVAEQNREAVEALRARGAHAVAGDASDPPVLIQAHIARASVLVLAIPDAAGARRMIETAKMLNPKVRYVIRAHSDEEAALLRKESAGTVLMGEEELAASMTQHVLDSIPRPE